MVFSNYQNITAAQQSLSISDSIIMGATQIQSGSSITKTHSSHQQLIKDQAEDTVVYGIKESKYIPVRAYDVQKEKPVIEDPLVIVPQQKMQLVAGWQTMLLLFTITLVGLAKAFSTNRFKETYKALFNYRVAQAICNEEKVFFHRVNILLSINYLITTSLLIFQIRGSLHDVEHLVVSKMFFLVVFGFLFLAYVVKLLFAQLLAFILEVSQMIDDYIFTITLFNNLLGVLLLPTLGILYFTSMQEARVLTSIALPVSLFSLLFRIVRLFVLGNLKGVSYFYIFLYICTLEILPLIVMIKIFILK